MIEIKNKIIPPSGKKAMTMWPFLFIRSKYMSGQDMRHEMIHGRQQREMLIVAAVLAVILALTGAGWWSLLALPLYFYWYGIEFVVRLGMSLRTDPEGTDHIDKAYKTVAFEQEAYLFDGDEGYLERRRAFHWLYFI